MPQASGASPDFDQFNHSIARPGRAELRDGKYGEVS